MKIWDKVTLTWDCYGMGLPTSLSMDGNLDLGLVDSKVIDYQAQEKVHGLFRMEAISQPRDGEHDQRKGEIVLDIRRQRGPNIPPNSEAIVKFLEARLNNPSGNSKKPNEFGVHIEFPATKRWTDTTFKLFFVLAHREQFCDTAIEIARGVFEGLGIKDESGYSLARFSIKRESYVSIDGSWITFARWLRMSHRLPIIGPEDSL